MASPEVLSLAKQGDPVAIATLMNQVTQPLGISVQVKYQGDCLHLLFEGEQAPEQHIAVSFVRSSIDILKIHALKPIQIYGRQTKSHHYSWREVMQSQSYFDSPVPQLPHHQAIDEMPRSTSSLPLVTTSAISDSSRDDSNLSDSDLTDSDLTDLEKADLERADLERAEASLSDSELEIFNTEIFNTEIFNTEISDTEPVPPLSQNLLTEATPTQAALIPMDTSSLAQHSDSALTESSEIPDFLKRPESIVFVFMTTLFVFWGAYLSLLDEFAPEASLSCRHLSQRLGVSKSTVRKRKRQRDFSEWSKSLDPEGLAWIYQGGGLYRPVA